MQGGKVILLADDELPVRKVISEILHQKGYVVLEANSGRDALKVSDTHRGAIDLLVADCDMPGMSGLDLAEQLQRARPELPVIVMSGATDDLAISHVRGWPFLRKPFSATAIIDTIENALRRNQETIKKAG